MKNILNFFKYIYEVCKGWIIANGIEGILSLLAAIGLYSFGYKFPSGIALGIFVAKNWHLLITAIKSLR